MSNDVEKQIRDLKLEFELFKRHTMDDMRAAAESTWKLKERVKALEEALSISQQTGKN